MKPGSDVCATCELLRQDVHRAVNEPQTEQAIEKLRDHMEAANKEREYYKAAIVAAKDDLENPDSGSTHLTIDFAQQLELPGHTVLFGPCTSRCCIAFSCSASLTNRGMNKPTSSLVSSTVLVWMKKIPETKCRHLNAASVHGTGYREKAHPPACRQLLRPE